MQQSKNINANMEHSTQWQSHEHDLVQKLIKKKNTINNNPFMDVMEQRIKYTEKLYAIL